MFSQMQLVEIGQAFGGRDHCTVIHSVDKVERQMARDRAFASGWRLVRHELCGRLIVPTSACEAVGVLDNSGGSFPGLSRSPTSLDMALDAVSA